MLQTHQSPSSSLLSRLCAFAHALPSACGCFPLCLVGKLLHMFKPPAQMLFCVKLPQVWPGRGTELHQHPQHIFTVAPGMYYWHLLLCLLSPALCSEIHCTLRSLSHTHMHSGYKGFPNIIFPCCLLCTLLSSIIAYSVSFLKNMLVHPLNSFCYSLKNIALEPPVGRQVLCL